MNKKNKNITAIIPARGGSKGIQNKNIKEFAKKPLITHTIEYAFESQLINEVVVSTDNNKISPLPSSSTSFAQAITLIPVYSRPLSV